MKPIAHLMICKHCHELGLSYACEFQLKEYPGSEPCTTQDYLICPLKGMDDKDVRTGKRTV
jgi:hypothetical protein